MNTQIYEEAAHWLVEFRTGDNDPATRKRFDAWIRKSPEHLRAYLEITEIWQDAAFVGEEGDQLSRVQLLENARKSDANVVSLTAREISASQGLMAKRPRSSWPAIAASLRLHGQAAQP